MIRLPLCSLNKAAIVKNYEREQQSPACITEPREVQYNSLT